MPLEYLIARFMAFDPKKINKKQQIMDPKMDSGFVPPGDSFEPEFDVSANLSPSQILWIMDEIFRLEMSFHDGYPLAQNLFTSLHIFDLAKPDSEGSSRFGNIDSMAMTGKLTPVEESNRLMLFAYCVAVVKCVQPMLGTITNQMYWEEEDFVSHVYGSDLLSDVSHQDARKLLVEAMDWLDESDIDRSLKYALKYRLIFREHLLFSMDKSHECWEKLISRLDAKNRDGSIVISSHRELSTPVPEAFSNKVTRQLATSTPPRPMPNFSWEDARVKCLQMCEDILAAQRLTRASLIGGPHALLRATWAFAYRQPVPNTFARAKMQDLLCTDNTVRGDTTHFDLMLEDMRELYLAGDVLGDIESFEVEFPGDPRHKASRLVEDFIVKVSGEYVNMYRIVCQNRSRLRRNLCQSIAVWKEMEAEAMHLDTELRKVLQRHRFTRHPERGVVYHNPISAWVHSHLAQMMQWVMLLGFETELYLPKEMSVAYGYIFYFAQNQERNLDCTATFNVESLETAQKNGQQQYVDECRAAAAFIKVLHVRNHLHLRLGLALAQMYTLLERLRIVDISVKRYEKAELQFQARMKPFLNGIRDKFGFMSEAELQNVANVHASMKAQDCFKAIPENIKTAKTQLAILKKASPRDGKFYGTEEEWMAEIKKLERTCISVMVETSKLEGLCKKHGAEGLADADLSHVVEAELPFASQRYHMWWVVPQIREKKI